ncbi:hypothetical protein [Pseudomonas sp. BIGb0164]|uniref:hypothetical protein n=1 Tax=Pseudomonas sp. BIGb0164 TaxID=2940605 RepID=UPI0021674E97|nr:hypothetical protein [Pseudomonas sp. BIGb0164]MCS4249660.1 hypothetical protein [Pseudomonas sp. BIGb0164]
MFLADECLKRFVLWLVSLPFLSAEVLEDSLQDLGGMDGIIENSYCISAYESLGRALVQENSFQSILEFFRVFELELRVCPEHLYYFVESIVDWSLARGDQLEELISVVPENYKEFLHRRFSPR